MAIEHLPIIPLRRRGEACARFAALTLLAAIGTSPAGEAATIEKAKADYERGDYQAVLAGFLVHAEQGSPEAALCIGLMYDDGTGVPEKDDAAAAWYHQAAVAGNRRARESTGRNTPHPFSRP